MGRSRGTIRQGFWEDRLPRPAFTYRYRAAATQSPRPLSSSGANTVALRPPFFAAHKPVAAICHAPLTLIDAEVIDGRRPTAFALSDGANDQANSSRHDRITRSALSTTCSVVKPYSRMTTLPGAEAPNLSTEITFPFGPAYRCQP